ncbi:HAD-superfamily hydrolase, subfamily IA, variant 3 [Stanieria cyanosphaera PCC 7437]|uniref:HAD-superfamily hydrolase, subfamily IA, variant 3 n=1 Tax=Stanieria cyanosphaera (strain ATCC 29371 / PCC 7437) TaxID=111780 RepID=K9XVM7_STAC7|nr:HAD family phosphatase [Stanieria cyanosphaera]AFZ36645.1 HAD-superfamily hydrolase, subfamily IA, variant 3 [Stanieria cyanosphaera PCC 7437]
MTLKAILFDFNGVIINDEAIHQELINHILLGENLRPEESEYREICLGRSDRICLKNILVHRGRFVTDEYIDKLVANKSLAYQEKLTQLETLPIYPEITEFLAQIQQRGLIIGLVTGALKAEVQLVLQRAKIESYFSVIVAGDDINQSKPEPDGYLLAVQLINQNNHNLNLQPSECLAIEDTYAGIEAAKKAGIQVVGIANTHPFHMLQRKANWTVDYLSDLELDRINQVCLSL